MTNLKKYLLPVLLMGSLAFNAAFAELTVVTVSMQKLFDGYYKSDEADTRLQGINEQAVAEAQEKQAELQKMVEDIRAMQEELQNPVLSEDTITEMEAELQAKMQAGNLKQQEFQQWQQQTRNELNAKSQEIRNGLIEEIIKIVNDIALKDLGADLVLDTSDIIGTGVPTVLYADSDLDITDKVLLKLNENKPVE